MRRLLLLTALALAACSSQQPPVDARAVGDVDHGKLVIVRYGCGSCHEIPGIPLADGRVGPPLANFGERTVVAGVLPNTPDQLTRWIAHPQEVVPGNAMPEMGLSDRDARDAAAYLYSLHRA